MNIELDNTDRKLLSLLQLEFPLTAQPFADIGGKLGISPEETMSRIRRLKQGGIIRQISPVLDARKLGYQSALVAMKIADDKLAAAEKIIRNHEGISHGYKRNHPFNVWITLSVPAGTDIKTELRGIKSATGARDIFDLPALKVFKLRTHFDMESNGDIYSESTGVRGSAMPGGMEKLSAVERKIINGLQDDLPLVSDPFSPVAAKLGITVEDLLGHCRTLVERGIIRRYGASISHRKAGYKANAMTCWAVEPDRVDQIGDSLAKLRQVSHCYERKVNGSWRYNLFAMIHGGTRDSCRTLIETINQEKEPGDCLTLFSTKEIKKVRIKYRV